MDSVIVPMMNFGQFTVLMTSVAESTTVPRTPFGGFTLPMTSMVELASHDVGSMTPLHVSLPVSVNPLGYER